MLLDNFSVVKEVDSSNTPAVGEVLIGYQSAQIIESVKGDPKQVKRWTSGISCQTLNPG